MDPKKTSDLDQSLALLLDMLPPLWWGLYSRLTKEGFTEDQAMRLVVVYIETSYNPQPPNE